VVGNRVLLAQVLQNLVNNAAKFHRPGVAPTIVVDAVEGNGEWTIRVTDDGVGVPVEHRDQVFVMFKRLAQTSDVPGSGIGLAICHRAVLAHGGRIWFDDVDGEGARVCFSVPG
jgi:signal transduction histidine kinase